MKIEDKQNAYNQQDFESAIKKGYKTDEIFILKEYWRKSQ